MSAQNRLREGASALGRLRLRDGGAEALRLRLAQEAARIGYWDYDVHTGEVLWDDTCADMFGIRVEQFEGTIEGFRRRCHPEDLPGVEVMLAAVTPGDSLELNYRAMLPDGGQRHLLARGQGVAARDGVLERIVGVVLDVTNLREAAETQQRLAERAAGLAQLAMALANAQTTQELVEGVGHQGAALLGANGSTVVKRDDLTEALQVVVTEGLDGARPCHTTLPQDSPLPLAVTARTGQPFLLPDRAAGLAVTPEMAAVYADGDRDAWACLPLRVGDRLLGALALSWAEPRHFGDDDRDLLGGLAAQASQALDRIRAREADRRRADEAARLLETLHRSLLSEPPAAAELAIGVRYQAAAREAAVGGDWYDAFRLPSGALCVAIGDCVGHDQQSAAAMAVARNVLRTTAYTLDAGPAAVLEAYDRTVEGLDAPVLASALLARVEPASDGPGLLLRWSSAGHLPPVVRAPDGTCAALVTPSDLLLGLAAGIARTEHEVTLLPGATLVLYTDGLVERRDEDIDTGLDRLTHLLADLGHLPIEQLCDALASRLLENAPREDDLALLIARVPGAVEQNPPAAGTERVVELAPDPGSAALARRALRELLVAAGREQWVEAAELAVSEVVTNGVVHARTPMAMTARLEGDRLRVEVRDNSSLPLITVQPDVDSTTGRGLTILQAVTSAHDVTPLGRDGKVVWFTVDDTAGTRAVDPLALLDLFDDGSAVGAPPPTALAAGDAGPQSTDASQPLRGV